MRVDRSKSEKSYIINAPLPQHGATYTVISHKDVIDATTELLVKSNFRILNESYRCNINAKVAQGIYYIAPNTVDPDIREEDELGMMFAWTNSYDKSVRFQCAMGAYVFACHNGMVCGELNYARKHTGTARKDMYIQIQSQIKNAEMVFKKIIEDKNSLKNKTLSSAEQAEIAGKMFFNEDLLTANQISCIKDEISKPSYNYGVDESTAWQFYNHVTHAYKTTHPKMWLSNTKKFHDYIMTEINSNGIASNDSNWNDDLTKAKLAEDVFEIEDSYIAFI
jgi:hypothetical protein